MTHVKKHKLYNVRQRTPQKLHIFSPVALQPFYLLLFFTLKKNEIAEPVLIIKSISTANCQAGSQSKNIKKNVWPEI